MAYYTFKKYKNENKTTVMIFCTGQACLPVHVLWWEWWQVHPAQDVRGAELSGDQPVRGVQGARGGPRLRVQCRQRWPLPQECVGGSCSKHVFVVITVAEVGTGHNKEPIRNGINTITCRSVAWVVAWVVAWAQLYVWKIWFPYYTFATCKALEIRFESFWRDGRPVIRLSERE